MMETVATHSSRRPHCPYEGLKPSDALLGLPYSVEVLIAPTRD